MVILPFLSCSVPQLQRHHRILYQHRLDLEVHPYGRLEGGLEPVVTQPHDEGGLTHRTVP